MKKLTQQQQKFIMLRAQTGKSFFTLSLELNTPVEQLLLWDDEYTNDIESIRQREIDEIKEYNKTSFLPTYKYLSETYSRLKKELDKRDFSGLPTDKLYYIMDHIHKVLINMETQDLEETTPDYFLDEDEYV